jgi:CRP/FNR family transcriptional regulator, cyclic AMP receptor protein
MMRQSADRDGWAVDREKCEAIVRSIGWLSRQPAAFQSALLKQAKLTTFDAEETVYLPGADLGGIFGAISGSFRVYVPGRRGNYALTHILRAGVWFGEGPINSGGVRTMGFVAAEPANAFHVSFAQLSNLVSEDVQASRSIASLSEFGLNVAAAAVSDLLIPSGEKRIASVLLRVTGAEEIESSSPPRAFRLTQAQLGEMANASRDLVNRTLKKFEAKGWLTSGYNQIVINDAPSLSRFASE